MADSRSSDQTIDVARNYQDQLPITIAMSNVRSPGAARNAGAKQATAEYLIFIDADMRLPNTAFEQTMQATQQGKVGYVTPLFSTPGHHPIDQLAVKMINFDIRYGVTAKAHLPGIGGYICVRRNLHENLDGFAIYERGEDMNYLARLKHRGTSYVILKNLFIETSNRRLKKDGRLVSALHYIPQRWRLNKYILRPFMKKIGKEKKFGIF